MQYQLSYAHETKTFYIIEKTSQLLNEACGDSPFGCCIQQGEIRIKLMELSCYMDIDLPNLARTCFPTCVLLLIFSLWQFPTCICSQPFPTSLSCQYCSTCLFPLVFALLSFPSVFSPISHCLLVFSYKYVTTCPCLLVFYLPVFSYQSCPICLALLVFDYQYFPTCLFLLVFTYQSCLICIILLVFDHQSFLTCIILLVFVLLVFFYLTFLLVFVLPVFPTSLKILTQYSEHSGDTEKGGDRYVHVPAQ